MKIYTKKGDKGSTGLYGGERVSKHHLRLEAYGDLDELNSHLGHLRDLIEIQQDILLKIQDQIFSMGSHLATPSSASRQLSQLPKLDDELTELLEKEIDSFNEELPPMTHFILPGGHPHVSICHITRTVCRRAERKTSLLADNVDVPEEILRFINRLSDYLFVLARKLTYDYQAEEIRWIPKP
ncbi:MAG: cob(I)yrinic acid a,c-diamide adenosyltransferase [Flavobacteriaceae bacterium]